MTEPTCKSRFTFRLPDSWTPDQALAIVEFIGDLRDATWAHYQEQLVEAYRELYASDDGDNRPAHRPAITPFEPHHESVSHRSRRAPGRATEGQ